MVCTVLHFTPLLQFGSQTWYQHSCNQTDVEHSLEDDGTKELRHLGHWITSEKKI